MTPACPAPGCGAPLPHRLARYCSPACRDREIHRVMAEAIAEMGQPRAKASQPARTRSCAKCGNDLPPGSKRRFCTTDCYRAYLADREKQG